MSIKSCTNCGKEKNVWKRVENKPYCQSCSMILFSKKQTKMTKPLNKRSAKKTKEDNIYSDLRKEFLTKHPVCVAHLPGCTQSSTDVHHSYGRNGDFYLDTSTWVSLCRNCHTTIELNPNLGRDLGFVKTRKK